MRQLFALALCAWTIEDQAEEAIHECSQLSANVAVYLLRGRGNGARLARSIADMELICERLRLIVGADLVDLEKASSLQHLQVRLARAAQHAAANDHLGAA